MTKKMIVALAVTDWTQEEADALAVDEYYMDKDWEKEYSDHLFDMYQYEQEFAKRNPNWREQTEAWLADPANYDDENYSDIYKELYGVRPHRKGA